MLGSSNWSKLKRKIEESVPENNHQPRKKHTEITKALRPQDNPKTNVEVEATNPAKLGDKRPPSCNIDWRDKNRYVGLDCEMVGIGIDGKQSALARCSLVDFDGNTIYDAFVRPPAFVTDFRTKWSGIRKQDLRHGHAISLQEAAVAKILKGKVLVGHALNNDLDALLLSHPRKMIRDTARYKPLMRPHGRNRGKFRPRSLKDLTAQFLKTQIQGGEHDSSEDARAAMFLYRMHRDAWEESLSRPRLKRNEDSKQTSEDEVDSASDNERTTDVDAKQSKTKSAGSHAVSSATKSMGLSSLLLSSDEDKFGSKVQTFKDVDLEKARRKKIRK